MWLIVLCLCLAAILVMCYQITLRVIAKLEHRVFAEMIREIYVLDDDDDIMYAEKGGGDLRPHDREIPHMRIVDNIKKKRSRMTRWQQKFYLNNPQLARKTKSCEDLTKALSPFNNPVRRRMSELY